MKTLIWFIQAALFYLFTLVFAILPECAVRPTGLLIGRLSAILIPKRRKIAIENIRLALPAMKKNPDWNFPALTPEEIAREMFGHLGMSLVETARLYHGRGERLIEQVELRGREHFEAARARGKGVIVLTGHCGNWELAALALARQFNSTMSVVARRQNSPYLNSMVEKMRMRYNNKVIYKDNALRNMLAVFRKNGMVGLLIDQAVFPEEGALIDFLGRKAWASKTPVLLARKSGTAVLPAFIHREADRHIIDIYPELTFSSDNYDQSMAADVKEYSRAIENFIIRHPADWYWVHRRWKRAGELAEAA
jgi:Kdo2-lipid IVA lauroyltransferase/acyltransferase